MKNIKAIYFAVADKRKQIFSHKEGFFFYSEFNKKIYAYDILHRTLGNIMGHYFDWGCVRDIEMFEWAPFKQILPAIWKRNVTG